MGLGGVGRVSFVRGQVQHFNVILSAVIKILVHRNESEEYPLKISRQNSGDGSLWKCWRYSGKWRD